MAALGYGPGAGLPGVPSPEDSKRDVGRISLSSGEPLHPVNMRVGQTHAWMRIRGAARACGAEPVSRPQSRRRPEGRPLSSPGERLGSGPGTPRGDSRRGDVFPEPAPKDCSPHGP